MEKGVGKNHGKIESRRRINMKKSCKAYIKVLSLLLVLALSATLIETSTAAFTEPVILADKSIYTV